MAEVRRGSGTCVGLGSAPGGVARDTVRGQPPRGAVAMVSWERSREIPWGAAQAPGIERTVTAPSGVRPHAVSRGI